MNQLVQKLSAAIEKLEGVRAKKTAKKISYARHNRFAEIRIGKDKLELDFITPSKINHARLEKVKKLKSNKFQHTVEIRSKQDFNPQITGWILIAHATN